MLVLRITVARRPFEGWSSALALASGALGGLAVWILASALWSDAPARALVEFDRALLYLLVVVLTGSAAARSGDLATVLRWVAAALVAIALAGLLTRLAPNRFPIADTFLPERISFPLTYWNAMGIACALAVVLLVHLSASGREPAVVRVVAAAALCPVAVTLYLTFSRGAIWALPVGLLVYVLLAQPRGILTAAPPAVLAAIAVKAAYGAEALARVGYDSAAAAPEARRVGVAVLACAFAAAALRAAALPVDGWLASVHIPARRLRTLRVGIVAAVVVLLGAGALAADAPRRLAEARATFSESRALDTPDLRERLTSAIDNGRVPNWRVALDAFQSNPLHGTGAGTYRVSWDRRRPPPPAKVNDGHSLYLETLSELGVIGLGLVVLALGTILAGGLARLGGRERHAHAAFVAAGLMLALHAALDWDWEMPALFVWLFGAGGVVLARRQGAPGALGELGRTPRVIAGLAVLVLAITPALFATSQPPLDRALAAFVRRDCETAIDAALDATERFGVLPEPWLVLGYCDARGGQYALARRAIDAARARDPDNWQIAYGQAIVHGVSGGDARPYAAQALRLNPLGEHTRELVRNLRRAGTAARRREVARRAPIPFE